MGDAGIIYNIRNSLKTEEALAYLFVSVLCGAEGIFGVVKVNGAEAVKTDDRVKCVKNVISCSCDLISSVGDVSGVKANANVRAAIIADSIDNGSYLFKGLADL